MAGQLQIVWIARIACKLETVHTACASQLEAFFTASIASKPQTIPPVQANTTQSFQERDDALVTVESSLFLFGGVGQHREAGSPGAASFRAAMTEPDRCERRLDRSQVHPVFSGEVVKREHRVAILPEALARFGVLRRVLIQEVVIRFVGLLASLGHPDLMDV